MELAVRIVRFVSDYPRPGVVACEFMDAEGRIHTFVDKVPVFTAENLDAASFYPHPGSAACGVLARWQDALGRELVRITTARPIEIQSTEGLSEFVVLSTQFLNTQRQRMTEPFIVLSAVEIRRTGFDGGHLYIKGRGAVGHYGQSDVYAFFGSRAEELNFDSQFRGQDLRITAHSIEFTAGIGVTLWGCHIVKESRNRGQLNRETKVNVVNRPFRSLTPSASCSPHQRFHSELPSAKCSSSMINSD